MTPNSLEISVSAWRWKNWPSIGCPQKQFRQPKLVEAIEREDVRHTFLLTLEYAVHLAIGRPRTGHVVVNRAVCTPWRPAPTKPAAQN